jgi:hypothetical protein
LRISAHPQLQRGDPASVHGSTLQKWNLPRRNRHG